MGLADPSSQFPKINVKPELWESLTQKEPLSTNFNYHSSHTFSKFIESLNLPQIDPNASHIFQNDLFDNLEDEELAKALDHHSIITSQLPDDHIQTADEIIEEIDRLMIDDPEVDLNLGDPQSTADCRSAYVWKPVSVLKQMSLPQLNSLVDELDTCIRHHSAFLVQELATREELDYEQEVKDIFFTRLHEVQGRMDEWSRRSGCGGGYGVDYDSTTPAPANGTNAADKKGGILGATNSAAAKAILASAALAVRRRWRRMGRSLADARTHLNRRRRHRSGQPLDACDLATDAKMCVSNSNIELVNELADDDDDDEDDHPWMSGSVSSARLECHSAATTPTGTTSAAVNSSPRRHQQAAWLTAASLSKRQRNPEEDLKFLGTKIPYHRSTPGDGGSEGPTVGHLELYNEFLLCMLTNNPNLTPLLTDYILNVYAPSEKSMPKLAI